MARDMPDNWQDAVIEIINDKIPNAATCPLCGGSRTLDEKNIVSPKVWSGDEKSAYPQVMIICQDCGYTTYHNVGTLGLLNNEAKRKKKNAG